jgi:hypothetical protein
MGNQNYRDDICDYTDTIFAILGFMNFYRYDDTTKQMRSNVKVFQGRRLRHIGNLGEKSSEENLEGFHITPDLGVVYTDKDGILAEVKKSFCRDQKHWIDDFKQLLSYDGVVESWPTLNGKLDNHEIALIVHQTRGRAVADYYQDRRNTEIVFSRPFTIIEFNRSDEANPYIFFRIIDGTLQNQSLNSRLRLGVDVPMEKLSRAYSEIKFYDSEPPYPYLLEIIWTSVILPLAVKDERFLHLMGVGKMEVKVEVEHIVKILYENFSFKRLHSDESNQPMIPQKEWVLRALELLVKAKEGKWIDREKEVFCISFKKYKRVLDHFIELCNTVADDHLEAKQTEFLSEKEVATANGAVPGEVQI